MRLNKKQVQTAEGYPCMTDLLGYKTMKTIGIIAPGSYGMLYVLNDEYPKHFNEFRVYALAKGNVEEKDT